MDELLSSLGVEAVDEAQASLEAVRSQIQSSLSFKSPFSIPDADGVPNLTKWSMNMIHKQLQEEYSSMKSNTYPDTALALLRLRFFENLMIKQSEREVKGTAFEGSADMIRENLSKVSGSSSSSSSSSSSDIPGRNQRKDSDALHGMAAGFLEDSSFSTSPPIRRKTMKLSIDEMKSSKFQVPYEGLVPKFNQQQMQASLGIEEREHYLNNNVGKDVVSSSSNRKINDSLIQLQKEAMASFVEEDDKDMGEKISGINKEQGDTEPEVRADHRIEKIKSEMMTNSDSSSLLFQEDWGIPESTDRVQIKKGKNNKQEKNKPSSIKKKQGDLSCSSKMENNDGGKLTAKRKKESSSGTNSKNRLSSARSGSSSSSSSSSSGSKRDINKGGDGISDVAMEEIICPICNRPIVITGRLDVSVAIDNHVDRCSRRSSRSSYSFVQEGEEEDFEEAIGGETITGDVKNKSLSTKYADESDDGSEEYKLSTDGDDSNSDSDSDSDEAEFEGDILPLSKKRSKGEDSRSESFSRKINSEKANRLPKNGNKSHSSGQNNDKEERKFGRITASGTSEINPRPKRSSFLIPKEDRGKVRPERHEFFDDWEAANYSYRMENHIENKTVLRISVEEEVAGSVGRSISSTSITFDSKNNRSGDLDENGIIDGDINGDYNAKAVRFHSSVVDNSNDHNGSSEYNNSKPYFYAPQVPWEKLHHYQKEGVRWLWGLCEDRIGGVLGDEMGLGKTAQLCVHFGAIAQTTIKRHQQRYGSNSRGRDHVMPPMKFLVICPATVLQHWNREMNAWNPLARSIIMHSISPTFNEILSLGENGIRIALEDIFEQEMSYTGGTVVITTYDTFRTFREILLGVDWNAVCLDEGQKIRNPDTLITNTVKMLQTSHRIILSGTPIQNSLRELWSLFDFTCTGMLGSLQAFELEFANPIRQGGFANATRLQSEVAIRTAATLQRMLKPYLLRRRKDDVSILLQLPGKTEQVLFCKLSEYQRSMYKDILNSPEVQAVIEKRIPAFRAITTLRKVCNHPALAFQKGRFVWSEEEDVGDVNDTLVPTVDELFDGKLSESRQVGIRSFSWENSGKLLVLSKILPLWYAEKHKVLIFSQTQSMLNLVEVMIKQLKYTYMRLDGSTMIARREDIISKYNADDDVFVMLLTTRTGGVGISLTAANRVVIVDPDWNPQTDIQARERSWRIGQQRDVTIYRLITRGTIEEKIYQRQIFKELLSNRILENAKQKRLFSSSTLHDLFELTDFDEANSGYRGGVDEGCDLPASGKFILEEDDDDYKQNQFCFDDKEKTRKDLYPAVYDDDDDDDEGKDHNDMLRNKKNENNKKIAVKDAAHSVKQIEGVDDVAEFNDGSDENKRNGDDKVRDKKLLKALFNGEAISAVYDHSSFEDKATRKKIEEGAKRIVEDAVKHLKASNNVHTHSSGAIATSRFGSSGNSALNSSGMSSNKLLSTIRANNAAVLSASHDNFGSRSASSLARRNFFGGSSNDSAVHRTMPSQTLSCPTDILPRLKRMFNSLRESYSTHEILERFTDVSDQHASIFKTLLKQVAKLQDGRWVGKN